MAVDSDNLTVTSENKVRLTQADNAVTEPLAAAVESHKVEGLTKSSNSTFIGPYEVLAEIGSGGMGVVYRVKHRGAGTMLAMKVMRAELAKDPINIKRFQQELKTSSSLTHPNIVPIYDSGTTEDGLPYFVMELLDGVTLEELLSEEGYLDLEKFHHFFTQICDALIQAHEKRIIHRDLKPSNIAVSVNDNGLESVKILDFGIARVYQRPTKDSTRLTQLGEIVGSPVYMSPEQCLNQKLDERSDIYSLGILMYECLAGRPPFLADNPVEIMMAHLQSRPKSIGRARPDFNIPPDLEALIITCLEKDPAARFRSVLELSSELNRVFSSIRGSGLIGKCKRSFRRTKSLAKQQWKRAIKSRTKWLMPTITVFALAYACLAPHNGSAAPMTTSGYIDRAKLAIMKLDYVAAAQNWHQAIGQAQRSKLSILQLAALNEEAGDDMISETSKEFRITNQYGRLKFADEPDRQRIDIKKLHLAEVAHDFYRTALPLYQSQDDRIRVLDKLASTSKSDNKLGQTIAYLNERIKLVEGGQRFSSENLGVYRDLATLLEQSGRNNDAETMWKKEAETGQDFNWNYDQSKMEELACFYERIENYKAADKIRNELVARLLSDLAEDQPYNRSSYVNQFNSQLRRLAENLRKEGRIEEANNMLKRTIAAK